MRAFRAADKRVGGSHLYATVVSYLQTEVGPRLFGNIDSAGSQTVFAAAAALTEMAGWMAHDAGRDTIAEQHFDRALTLVKLTDDVQLGSHILASMSHLAHHRDQPERGIRLARAGREAFRDHPPQPELQAQLLAMQARGYAAAVEPGECARLLIEAERALGGSHAEEPSPWISRFDEGSLASEAARCMRQLGNLGEARRQAERVISLRQGDRTRSRAFGQLILARVLIAQGELEDACALAQGVLEETRALGSFLVVQELSDLRPLLEPYSANGVVVDFLSCLREDLNERMWLSQWLRDGYGYPTASGEGP